MKELEILLNRRWVLKSEDKALYYRIRDAIVEIRRFAVEKLGCQIIENSTLVKLEKIPAIPESFMGIQEFASKEEYAFLCILLMFLEDQDPQAQFILSTLTEYISANMPGGSVEWTSYTNRRRLIKVLRYAADIGILHVTDGSDEQFMEEESGEVLYENTGASRYFMRNFPRDIMGYEKPEDFEESQWMQMNEERGFVRRHRVYNRLLFSVAMYKGAGMEEDFEYLKYYGRRLSEDLEQSFDCQVHIHRGSAFFLPGEDCHIGALFPANKGISDIVLLCCANIRKQVENGQLKPWPDETITLSELEFDQITKQVKDRCQSAFTKQYAQMSEEDFAEEVKGEMEKWMMIECEGDLVTIYPAAGKLTGYYPHLLEIEDLPDDVMERES